MDRVTVHVNVNLEIAQPSIMTCIEAVANGWPADDHLDIQSL